MIDNIYIVDDDDLVRVTMFGVLSRRSNLVIRSFPSGDLFLADAPDLEAGVVLLDLRMPGSDGVDVLNALRSNSPDKFATIVATGEGDTQLAVKVMKLGAVDFIEKPYEVEDLLSAVDAAFVQLGRDQAATNHANKARAQIAGLSPRERDVLAGLIEGQANKLIAYNCSISPRTVEVYRASLMTKLGVNNLAEALRIAFAAGMAPTSV